MRSLRTLIPLTATAAAAGLLSAAAAWACIAGPNLIVTPQSVAAGGTVAVSGISWNKEFPVVIRFDALDGPVLGTFQPDPDTRRLAGSVTLPTDLAPGNYVLIGTQQSAEGQNAIIPARALVSVEGAGGAPVLGAALTSAGATDRPAGLAVSDPVGTGSLLLTGLGAAGVALFLAGAGVYLTTRRRPEPQPEPQPVLAAQ